MDAAALTGRTASEEEEEEEGGGGKLLERKMRK